MNAIITTKKLPKNVKNVIYKCQNPSHNNKYTDQNNAEKCKKCGEFVCSYCGNFWRDHCVFCIIKEKNIMPVCKLCEFNYEYFMCGNCEKLITKCNKSCSRCDMIFIKIELFGKLYCKCVIKRQNASNRYRSNYRQY